MILQHGLGPVNFLLLIVLVNWKRAGDTLACLESLRANIAIDFVVAVCDNASNDGSEQTIRQYFSKFGTENRSEHAATSAETFNYSNAQGLLQAVFVRNDTNSGFAAGNNIAYRAATQERQYDYTWFLNNDTEIEPGCVEALLATMRSNEHIGMCGATLVYAHDRQTVQALGGARYGALTGQVTQIGHGSVWPQKPDESAIARSLSYVSGASMFASSRFLAEVGLMSEAYFLFFEELDWAQRGRRAGFALGYASAAVVYHKEGASIGTGTGAARSKVAEYFGLRSKLIFTWRFFPWAWPLVWGVSWLQVMRRTMQGRYAHALLMGRVLLGVGASPMASDKRNKAN